MEKKRYRAPPWEVPLEELKAALVDSQCYADVLRKLEISCRSNMVRALKRRLRAENLDFEHIKHGRNLGRGGDGLPAKVRRVTKKQMWEAVREAECMSDVLKKLDLSPGGSTRKVLRERLDEVKIDYGHLVNGRFLCRGAKKPIPLDKVLRKNSYYRPCRLAERILEHDLLEYKCGLCGHKPRWKNRGLRLVLNPINGIRNDTRIENLRFLCPNCDEQVGSWYHCPKKGKKLQCPGCGRWRKPATQQVLCPRCREKEEKAKEEAEMRKAAAIKGMVEQQMSYYEIGKELDLDGHTIGRIAKKYGIESRAARSRRIGRQPRVYKDR